MEKSRTYHSTSGGNFSFTFDFARYYSQSTNIHDILSKEGGNEKYLNGIELTDAQREYLLPHFAMLIVGKPGSGKTSLIKAMMTNENYYYRRFDHVMIISPSANKMGVPVRKDNMAHYLSLGWIENKLREINKQQVKDIIRELKHENKLRPFQPEPSPSGGKLGMFAAPLPMKMQQAKFGGAHPNIVKDKYSHKLLGNEMVAEFSQGLGLPRSMAEDIKDAEKLSLPEFVDEMQERYVTKLEFEYKRRTYKNVLIIMDDVVSQIKKLETEPLLSQLFFNRRHLIVNGMVSVMVVSQKYTMVPVRIRSNLSWLILYRLNPVDFENVYKDVIMMPAPQWKELLQFVYGESYSKDNGQNAKGSKNHDTLGVWVEFDVLFKNFYRLRLAQQY